MIFQRAIRRELLSAMGAVFTALFTIIISVTLIRILGDAAAGKIASSDVLSLLGFASLINLPVLISLSTFIAVLMVVARSYQDSEMVVWFASGVSLMDWVRPVMQVGLPMVILTAVLSFWLTPWSQKYSAEQRERFRNREDISRVSPGKFQESANGEKVFFVEGFSSDTTKVKNVFLSQNRNQESGVVLAREGTMSIDARGDKLLQLHDGRRYDGMPGSPEFRIMDFERYTVVIASNTKELAENKSARVLPTTELIIDPTPNNLAELLFRISAPLTCLMQMLLAIPLGFVNPRRGRTLNLMIALLLAVTYFNVTSIMQAMVAQGKASFGMSWWPLHLAAGALIILLFFWRNNPNMRWHPSAWLTLVRRMILPRSGGTV
ncbi:COG0795 Predicted permeases [Oxalobacteraceae bacterium]